MSHANYPTTFASEMLTLHPDDFTSPYGAGAVQELADNGLVVIAGVTERLAGQIATIGAQAHIREYCPKDATDSRFGSQEAFIKWLGKGGGRGMTLIGAVAGQEGPLRPSDLDSLREDDITILAYGWSGSEENKHIPGADITTAYRVAEAGAGKGLGSRLARLVTASAIDVFGVQKPDMISLETWASNKAAVHLYGKVGYEAVDGVKPVADVRPTLHEVGELVNGKKAFLGKKDGKPQVKVEDKRLFKRFNPAFLELAG